MLLDVNKCYFIVIASSPTIFKPNVRGIMLWAAGRAMTPPPTQLPGGEGGPAHIYLPVFHLSSDCISFLSRAAGGFAGPLPSDPVEYNIKLQGGEKTCSALK